MKKLANSCKMCIISIWIVVMFLVACGKSAPSSVSSKYNHDTTTGLKRKRSADLMDILSNMLLDHSAGEGSEWPNFGNIFDNDYPMDDWMANEVPQIDYDTSWSDCGDAYGMSGLEENSDMNPPDSFDYSCSEEESNDVVPFVESTYQYKKSPANSNWNDRDFVVIKPGVEDTYRYRHESELGYGTNGGSVDIDWNRTPSRGYSEIEETLWRQLGKPQISEGFVPPAGRSAPPVTNSKEVKFNIFTCLSGPPRPEQETKNNGDEYLVLLIKKDHILGVKNEGNTPGNGTSTTTIAKPSTTDDESNSTEKTSTEAVVSTTLSSVHLNITVGLAEPDDCYKTTPIPSLSSTQPTFDSGAPSSSTANTMTVVVTESPSKITVHVPNSTTATEHPSTTLSPVRTSATVVTTSTVRPYWTTRYSMSTSETTEKSPLTTRSPQIAKSFPSFTIADTKVSVTKQPLAADGSTTENSLVLIVTERPSTTAASTTEIPAATTSAIKSNDEASSGHTTQSPSKTTHSVPITIASTPPETPTASIRPTPTITTNTEIPYLTATQTTTRTTGPASVVVGDSQYIATDGAAIHFSKATTVATVSSTIGDAVAETTLPPTTIAQTTTEMSSLSTTQIGKVFENSEGIVDNGHQYSTLPPVDIKSDAQITNNLEDINEEPSTTPSTTSTEETWTYVE